MSLSKPHFATGTNFAFVNALLGFGEDYEAQVGDTITVESSEFEAPDDAPDEIEGEILREEGENWIVRDTDAREYSVPKDTWLQVNSSPPITKLWEESLRNPHPDGVAFNDHAVPAELQNALNGHIQQLIENEPVDYHPGSGTRVRDLVHPSLYPYIEGRSKTLKSVEKAKSPEYDRFGRTYETSKYQWLPTPFRIDTNGGVTIGSYINNLDRGKYSPLYHDLEKLFSHAVPLLESVLGYVEETEFFKENLEDIEHEGDLPETADGGGEPVKPFSLAGRELQVIPKIVEYRIGEGEIHEGVWHVEGMSHEHIVATCLYVLDKDDSLSGGELRFKRAYTVEEAGKLFWNISQIRPRAIEDLVNDGVIPSGSLATPRGRLLVFPNSHIHKLSALTLNEGATEGRRRIIVFWVVDPNVKIPSTEEVAPQQGELSHEEALKIRLELMEERKRHKQTLNVRAVSLCEH